MWCGKDIGCCFDIGLSGVVRILAVALIGLCAVARILAVALDCVVWLGYWLLF